MHIKRYHSKHEHKRTDSTYYKYHCAQNKTRQQKPKKSERDGTQLRDKGSMDAFECRGWLFITLFHGIDIAWLTFQHKDPHVPYYRIDVDDDVKEFIRNNPLLKPTQVSTKYLFYLAYQTYLPPVVGPDSKNEGGNSQVLKKGCVSAMV
jgi:hypothetical protein